MHDLLLWSLFSFIRFSARNLYKELVGLVKTSGIWLRADMIIDCTRLNHVHCDESNIVSNLHYYGQIHQYGYIIRLFELQ